MYLVEYIYPVICYNVLHSTGSPVRPVSTYRNMLTYIYKGHCMRVVFYICFVNTHSEIEFCKLAKTTTEATHYVRANGDIKVSWK